MNYKDSESIVLRFFFGIAYTFEIFQNSIGQRILTSLIGLDDRCLPRDLILCHWAFEAHNNQFVRVVMDKLNYDYLLPNDKHDFVAVAYVIAKTPECTDEAIILRGYTLRDHHFIMLTDILSDKDGKLQVRSLDLRFNELTDTVRGMAGLFNRAAAAFQSLRYLALDNLYSHYDIIMIDDKCIDAILAILAQSLNEVVFSFQGNKLVVQSLNVFRDALCHHQLSNLTELRLEGSLSSEPQANAEFIQALGHCSGLKVLGLSSNNLCAPGGRALGNILPQLSLERLHISNAKLGDEGMSALNQGLKSTCHIGWLYLGNNGIHAAGILCLTNSIYAGKMVIKDSLDLSENPLHLEGAEAVVQLLSSEHFLAKYVQLSDCKLATAEDDSAYSISTYCGESSITCTGFREWVCGHEIKADGVEVLDLCKNDFSGEGFEFHVLAGFMHLCPHLRSLVCVGCNITSNDLEQLLSLLSQSNLNLEEWDLGDNDLDDDGVSALIEHLSMFPSLTSIHIDDNSQVSSETCRNLKEICEKRKGKIAKIDSPMVGPENGAGTDINNQCSIPDSVEPMITEPHPIRQEVQKVTTVVAEGKISHGQNEDASDDERYITPPAAKRVKLQEDESDQSILEARATLEDSNPGHSSSLVSSLSCTTGSGREDRSASVTSEEVVDQLPPTVESGRTATPGPKLEEIIPVIKEISKPYELGVQLGIESHELDKIEENHPRDVNRQMIEVIKYWLRNSSDCSWGALAIAVEKMGGHGNLVQELGDRHLENTTTTARS